MFKKNCESNFESITTGKKETFKMPSSSVKNPVSRKKKLFCEVEN